MAHDDQLQLPGGRVVPSEALTFRADTSGGPGGQHANRSATRVELRVNLDVLPISEHELGLVRKRLANRISDDGVISVRSADSRSQLQNRRGAIERMEALLAEALRREPPRIPTPPPRSIERKRRAGKTHRSQVKKQRTYRPGDDD